MQAIAEKFGGWCLSLDRGEIPEAVRDTASRQVLDVIGLCVAARREDYVAACLNATDGSGPCTTIGHGARLDARAAALVNGTAAHGEDYDDTFEGTPVHAGSVVVPAVLAAVERHGGGGKALLRGIAIGTELTCRMALVAPGAIHRAGFHPTAVIGALGAAAGVAAARRVTNAHFASALGIAGSLAAGIIEYLAEGTWTKRLHAGWAAHCGITAVQLARSGFRGPRTVLEGEHGFFNAFTNRDVDLNFGALQEDLGARWHAENIAFKPYACGTMAQPFIDCAIRLRERGVTPDEIASIRCRVGEGTVHRLWEPLEEKHRPSTPYSAKFSVPYCIAAGFLDGAAGLEQFTQDRVRDPEVLELASKVSYEVDPANEYPENYSGHLLVTLAGGRQHELVQPHLRGGRREPLSWSELRNKFAANVRHGGWTGQGAANAAELCGSLFSADTLPGWVSYGSRRGCRRAAPHAVAMRTGRITSRKTASGAARVTGKSFEAADAAVESQRESKTPRASIRPPGPRTRAGSLPSRRPCSQRKSGRTTCRTSQLATRSP